MLHGRPRRREKTREPRRLAAKDAPHESEHEQREQCVADPSVPNHPVEPPCRVGRRDQHDDQPVEEADGSVPNLNDTKSIAHALCRKAAFPSKRPAAADCRIGSYPTVSPLDCREVRFVPTIARRRRGRQFVATMALRAVRGLYSDKFRSAHRVSTNAKEKRRWPTQRIPLWPTLASSASRSWAPISRATPRAMDLASRCSIVISSAPSH